MGQLGEKLALPGELGVLAFDLARQPRLFGGGVQRKPQTVDVGGALVEVVVSAEIRRLLGDWTMTFFDEKNNGNCRELRFAAQRLDELKAVYVGQVPVRQHAIRGRSVTTLEAALAAICFDDLTLVPQAFLDEQAVGLAIFFVALNEEYTEAAAHHTMSQVSGRSRFHF